MSQSTAVILAAFLLTCIAVYLLGFYPFIPPWAIFIAWASFFHMEGGEHRNQAFMANILHLSMGASAAWISTIVLLNNPFNSAPMSTLWGPLMIGAVIAVIAKLSMVSRLSVMPAVIYGYASIFAYLGLPGLFSIDKLLSLSFQNALIGISVSFVLGTCAGYINAMLVNLLMQIRFKTRKPTS